MLSAAWVNACLSAAVIRTKTNSLNGFSFAGLPMA
jgi:hypothetical protein